MSLAIFEAPTIFPLALLTGETVRETTIRLPSLRCRTVSKWSIRSPRRMRVRIVRSSSCRSFGMTDCDGLADRLFRRVAESSPAPVFELVTRPSRFLLTIASSLELTIDPSQRSRSSFSRSAALICPRSVMSRLASSTVSSPSSRHRRRRRPCGHPCKHDGVRRTSTGRSKVAHSLRRTRLGTWFASRRQRLPRPIASSEANP